MQIHSRLDGKKIASEVLILVGYTRSKFKAFIIYLFIINVVSAIRANIETLFFKLMSILIEKLTNQRNHFEEFCCLKLSPQKKLICSKNKFLN